jgi:primosomal replication protein N
VELTGRVAACEPLRYTPGGVPVKQFRLVHESTLTEAGNPRLVTVDLETVVIGPLAGDLSRLAEGSRVAVEGFLARRSVKSSQVVLHASRIDTNL